MTRAKRVALVLWVLVTGAGAVYAQPSTNAVEFDVEPQSLTQALRDFARQAKVQVLYDPGVVEGRSSAGLRGNYEPAEALTLLLVGTNLIVEQPDSRTFTISMRPTEETVPADEPSLPKPVVEEIVVTSPRREKLLGELPMTVTVLSGEELQARNVSTVNEIANWLPTMQLSQVDERFPVYVIRGLASSFSTAGRTVDLLFDGATAGANFSTSSPVPLDVERLEMLKGPQGTFFGQSSLAGTIRLISVKPEFDEWHGSVGAKSWNIDGGDSSWQGDAVVNIPLIDGTLAARLGVSHEDRGGFLDVYDVTPEFLPNERIAKNGNPVEITAYRAAVNWNAAANLNVYLTARQQDAKHYWTTQEYLDRTPPGGDHLEFLDENFSATFNTVQQYESDENWATLRATLDFEALTLSSETTLYDRDIDLFVFREIPSANSVLTSIVNIPSEQTNLSQEILLTSADDDRFEWIAGAYWRDLDWTEIAVSEDLSSGVVASFDTSERRTQWALFGSATYRPLPTLSLEFGVRLFREDYDRGNTTLIELDGTPLFDEQASGDETFDQVSPRVALSLDLGNDMLLWGSVATGFRGGEIQLAEAVPEELRSSDPDENIAYEMGFKGRWFDDRLAGSLAVFYNDWRDIQVLVLRDFDGVLAGVPVNGDSAYSAGLEVELNWQPVDSLRLSAMGHYMETELEDTVRSGQGAGTFVIAEGVELTDAPKYSFALSGDYTQPMAGNWEGYLRADLLARAGVFSQLSNAPVSESDSYRVANVRLGVQSDHWNVSVFAHNVGNERAVIWQFPSRLNTASGVGNPVIPRRIGLAVRYQF